jgi:uncharacterized Zn finger protein (UPF0148 family)
MKTAFLLMLCLGVPALWGAAVPGLLLQEATCSECKAKLKPDAKFCGSCGAKIPEKLCAGCKMVLKPGAKFCPGCGMKVEEAPAPKPDPKPEPKPEPKADPKPDPDRKPAEPAKPQEPAKPAGQIVDADSVKQKLDAELRKFGTNSEEVNRAIDRGAAYLAAYYLKSNFSGDDDYLGAYALIHTNQYFSNGKLRDKIHAFLKSNQWTKSGAAVYCAGLRALALEATHDPDLKALTRECAEYLIEAQGPLGTWTYRADVPITPSAAAKRLESGVTISGGEPLDEEIKGELVERKNTSKNPGDGDTSCTQFAILGLHAAARSGFAAPKAVWEKCLKAMEERHCKDGGWHYHGQSNKSYGSMSCAGICTVALCRFYLGEKDYLNHPMLKAGLRWLGDNFSVEKNPNENNWSLYYLYSVERVGVFAATDTIGEHLWYGKGAKFLVGAQAPDGSWTGTSENKEKGTAFGLLFLTRATSPVRAIQRGGNGWLETHALNDTVNILFILDASGSMRDEMDGKEKFQIVKEVVESIVKMLPEGANVGMRVYGHRRTALDKDADLDSELVVPMGPIHHEALLAKVRALKCKGMTPLTLSLDEAIKDISPVSLDIDLVTILLTDGGETTRGAKPPEAAARLAASRKGMKVHVVGFDITEEDWREQLEKTAAAGNGQYFHARKAADLLSALQLAVVGAAEYVLLDKAGKEIHRGKLGDRRELPEGKYTFVVSLEGRKEEKTVWINTGVVTHATLSLGKLLKKQ